MSIEEKQRALEFTYIPNNVGMDGDRKYDIVYNSDNRDFPLRISFGGSGIDYPLELFVEVVDFLTSKGIIQPKLISNNSFIKPQLQDIPIPQIQKKEGNIDVSQMSANIDPLASFDITMPSTDVQNQSILPVKKITDETGPVIDSSTPDISEEIITRPVIHSRVKDGDPLSAEREAAALRSAKSEVSGKTIKRAHTTENN